MNKKLLEEVKEKAYSVENNGTMSYVIDVDDVEAILSDERLSKGVDVDSLVDRHFQQWKEQYHLTMQLNVKEWMIKLADRIISTVAPVEDKWVSPKTAISGKIYIVWFVNQYGKKRVCKAMYADQYYFEASDDTECDDDWFDVKDGIWYCPKGWYETNEYDEKQMQIPCEILGIIPLPQPPTPPINEEHRETERSEGTHNPSKEG